MKYSTWSRLIKNTNGPVHVNDGTLLASRYDMEVNLKEINECCWP